MLLILLAAFISSSMSVLPSERCLCVNPQFHDSRNQKFNICPFGQIKTADTSWNFKVLTYKTNPFCLRLPHIGTNEAVVQYLDGFAVCDANRHKPFIYRMNTNRSYFTDGATCNSYSSRDGKLFQAFGCEWDDLKYYKIICDDRYPAILTTPTPLTRPTKCPNDQTTTTVFTPISKTPTMITDSTSSWFYIDPTKASCNVDCTGNTKTNGIIFRFNITNVCVTREKNNNALILNSNSPLDQKTIITMMYQNYPNEFYSITLGLNSDPSVTCYNCFRGSTLQERPCIDKSTLLYQSTPLVKIIYNDSSICEDYNTMSISADWIKPVKHSLSVTSCYPHMHHHNLLTTIDPYLLSTSSEMSDGLTTVVVFTIPLIMFIAKKITR